MTASAHPDVSTWAKELYDVHTRLVDTTFGGGVLWWDALTARERDIWLAVAEHAFTLHVQACREVLMDFGYRPSSTRPLAAGVRWALARERAAREAVQQELTLVKGEARDVGKLADHIHAQREKYRAQVLVLEGAARALLAACDVSEATRGCFSQTDYHDNRCPKSRAATAEGWKGEWICECGREALDKAHDALAALLASPSLESTGPCAR